MGMRVKEGELENWLCVAGNGDGKGKLRKRENLEEEVLVDHGGTRIERKSNLIWNPQKEADVYFLDS